MITQVMHDKELNCKGRGFNCDGCSDKNECVEYTETPFKKYIENYNSEENWISYDTLAKHIKLAMKEFELHHEMAIEGYNFEDLICWLEHYKTMEIKEE